MHAKDVSDLRSKKAEKHCDSSVFRSLAVDCYRAGHLGFAQALGA